MARPEEIDVVERIEQFDLNDDQNKWGSAVRTSPILGPVIPVELVDERLAKLEQSMVALKHDCRTLSERLLRQKRMTWICGATALLAGAAIWAASSFLFGG